MSILKSSDWNLHQLLAGLLRRKFASGASANSDGVFVARLKAPDHSPSTGIAQRLTVALHKVDSLSFENLVKSVAGDLYQQELRKGAAVLDIGLFGSRLFYGDVIGEVEAGDGIYWEIKKQGAAPLEMQGTQK